ncbi:MULTISPECIES: DUF2267 domain-containing protein [Streptomyces]|uniref:DUF2267 domain-containing protein n=1 Tax=Streptomyces thermoviolaceus subsp. thermoviolaceus TaxID=66860 RepID=A0ABX0YQ48_STRTL|nr:MULTISPECIES: DUF2267 domain-containing protein [Streptomyces]MCM3262526.1 DUF2267 domain-containing protein [Streptomyces thermoviolaceus]NJP14054.1 DUF2267 domain-containing protein [Streptomyces thermoviolaceus subsp. thermoviolaceus]RSR97859.1 DUF2267 domain-containing protein [Streptomyces sp. WAC00469]WTD50405.1 DUF2267 domain-containing protein [Streptomyces thermoviolaceus]GGV63325.1 hypothetical protein GCM10010499_06020 [Streptomyces thermoviolaceus subsp. apingens]
MKLDEFLDRVRDRGEYRSLDEAEKVSWAVLWVLAARVGPQEAEELAEQLPAPLNEALLLERGRADTFDQQEFLRRVAQQISARPRTAEWDVGAVLSTVADAVGEERFGHLCEELPSRYADLFGARAR